MRMKLPTLSYGVAFFITVALNLGVNDAAFFNPTKSLSPTTVAGEIDHVLAIDCAFSARQIKLLRRKKILSTGTTYNAFPAIGNNFSANSPHKPKQNELNLITFDLDDTLFPIGPVVEEANQSMIRALHRFGYTATNDEVIAASKQIRSQLRETGDAITYTDLRKQSIRKTIEQKAKWQSGGVIHDSVIDTIFESWLSERQASAGRNLFPFAIEALETIRLNHANALVGSITNGRGNPMDISPLAPFFDFCVSGEDEGVFPKRKPDRGIYEAALKKFVELKGETDYEGLNWIHVGDDLANDIGASASCGAKAIWLTEESIGSSIESKGELPKWSTATQEELNQREKMDEMAREYVSAKIFSLQELPGAIHHILGCES